MSYGTIIGQGVFTASSIGLANPNPGVGSVGQANPAYIAIPSNVDWMAVRNYTRFGTAGINTAYFNGVANAFVGVEFYWQRGMAIGTGIVKYYGNGGQVLNGDTLVSGGFTLYDPSGQTPNALPLLSAAIATTASTNVTRPVVSTANTSGLAVGSIVRLSNTAQTDINGIDFVVGAINPGVSFTLLTASNPLATAPGAIGGAGFYRIVNYNPLFYPRKLNIVNITQAVNAQVSTSIAHGLTVGQEVRFSIPSVSGMIQLNYSASSNTNGATIVSVIDDYNFTINVDTTGYTAFTYPTIAQQPSSFPIVIPIGEDTAASISSVAAQTPSIGGVQIFNTNTGLLADSTVNTGYLGMILGNGGNGTVLGTPILGPSGAISWSAGNVPTGDVVYWLAGKSEFGGL
jgi:hypothetical protein